MGIGHRVARRPIRPASQSVVETIALQRVIQVRTRQVLDIGEEIALGIAESNRGSAVRSVVTVAW